MTFEDVLGRWQARRLRQAEAAEIPGMRERPGGFTARPFHDRLCRQHGFTLGCTWTRLRLQDRSGCGPRSMA